MPEQENRPETTMQAAETAPGSEKKRRKVWKSILASLQREEKQNLRIHLKLQIIKQAFQEARDFVHEVPTRGIQVCRRHPSRCHS